MRVTIRPIQEPQREIDVGRRLVAAIAEELWLLYGGNDVLNWQEAERHLRAIVGAGAAPLQSPDTAGGPSRPFRHHPPAPRAAAHRHSGPIRRAPAGARRKEGAP